MKALLVPMVAALTLIPLICTAAVPIASTNAQFEVVIRDLPAPLVAQKEVIKNHILMAARMWAGLIRCEPCKVTIGFEIRDAVEGDPRKLGYGKSVVSAPFPQPGPAGKQLAEQGWASLLCTGKRPGTGETDIEIAFQTAYVLKEFWWDPDPAARRAPVPAGKLDALSVLLHELGHAIAFNGWLDPGNGKLNGNHLSTYDRWVKWDGHDFTFNGPNVLKLRGRPLLLGHTVNNYHHLGEERAGIPIDQVLRNDLMTGYHFQWARRYYITPLDIAVLQDCGIRLRR